jgi:hypothetical protein
MRNLPAGKGAHMADEPRPDHQDMTDQEIRDLFKKLKLPTASPAQPPAQPSTAPVVRFVITGDSLPLSTR